MPRKAGPLQHGTRTGYGRGCRCADCCTAQCEYDRAYYLANREARIAKAVRWQQENPERHRSNRRRRSVEAPEVAAESHRRWVAANPERRAAQLAAWRKANPEKVAMTSRLSRARRKGTPTTQAGRDYCRILAHDPCAYCGETNPVEFDHITPLMRGGDGDWTNFTPACRSCNARKATRSLLLYLHERAAA